MTVPRRLRGRRGCRRHLPAGIVDTEQRRNRSPESGGRILGSRARAGAHEALLASFHALRNESYLKTLEASVAQDRDAPLEKLAVPTLVVTGDEDRVYPPELAQRMAQRIPGIAPSFPI